MPCYLCNAIQQNMRGASAGDHLVQSGPAEFIAGDGEQPIKLTHYKCSECGSRWQYVDDPADPMTGWQFLKRNR